MLIGSAVLLGVLAVSMLAATARFPEAAVVYGAVSATLIGLVSIWALLKTGHRPAFAAAYFAADVVIYVPGILFWRLASRLFDPRSAKRYLTIVAASGTLACIGAGIGLRPFTLYFGTAAVLLVAGALLVGFLLIVALFLADAVPTAKTSHKSGTNRVRLGFGLAERPYVMALGLVVAASAMAITLVQFQFQVGATARMDGDTLTAYFGLIYGIGGGLSLICQLVLARHVFARGGLLLALRLLPICLLVAMAWSLLVEDFQGIVASRLAILALAFSIDLAGMQILYLGLPAASRVRVRTTVELAIKPAAIALTGLALVFLKSYPTALLVVVATIALFWGLPLVRAVHHQYLHALSVSLRGPLVEYSAGDIMRLQGQEIARSIEHEIRSSMGERLLVLSELAGRLEDIDLRDTFRDLRTGKDSIATIAALNYLAHRGDAADRKEAESLLSHPGGVGAAALHCFLRLGGTATSALLEEGVSEDTPEALEKVLTALLASESAANDAFALQLLSRSAASPLPRDRYAAASAAGTAVRLDVTELLTRLLEDDSVDVRKAAAASSASRLDSALVDPLLALLTDPEAGSDAESALSEYGSRAWRPLVRALQHPQPDRRALPGLLRVVERTQKPVSMEVLRPFLSSASKPIRVEAAKVLGAQATSVGGDIDRQYVDSRITATVASLAELESWGHQARLQPDAVALGHAVRESYGLALLELLHLLRAGNLTFDPEAMGRHLLTKGSPQRAKAVEFFDEGLSGKVRTQFLQHFDSNAEPPPALEPAQFASLLHELSSSSDVWVSRSAQWLLSRNTQPRQDISISDASDFEASLPPELEAESGLTGRVLLLRKVSLFRDLSLDELALLSDQVRAERHVAGEALFKEGDAGDRLFIVAQGRVAIHRAEETLAIVESGGYFGELSLLDGSPRSASAKCVTDCLLLAMTTSAFQLVLRRHSAVAVAISRALANDLRIERTNRNALAD